MAVEVGQSAPDFTLYDTDRKQRSLSEFRGKNVVLAFFPGAFSGVCTKEACTLRDQIDQFNSMNAQVLGISVDPPGSQKAWADQNHVTYPFLSDFNRRVVNQYDIAFPNFGGMEGYVTAKRSVFVLDKNGVVRYKWVSDTPGVEPNYDEVRQAVEKLPK
jgi:glutaredoxin-dependent peroxiredoxin